MPPALLLTSAIGTAAAIAAVAAAAASSSLALPLLPSDVVLPLPSEAVLPAAGAELSVCVTLLLPPLPSAMPLPPPPSAVPLALLPSAVPLAPFVLLFSGASA